VTYLVIVPWLAVSRPSTSPRTSDISTRKKPTSCCAPGATHPAARP